MILVVKFNVYKGPILQQHNVDIGIGNVGGSGHVTLVTLRNATLCYSYNFDLENLTPDDDHYGEFRCLPDSHDGCQRTWV